jgi:hypothetical protein
MGERETAGALRTSGKTEAERIEDMKARVRKAKGSIDRVIETEDLLRADPDRRDRAEDRIIQAEREGAILDAELNALDAGDLQAVSDLHDDYMRKETAAEER